MIHTPAFFAAPVFCLLAFGLAGSESLQNPKKTATKPAAEAFPRPEAKPYADLRKLAKQKEGTVRLYLLRHGQSVANASNDDPKLSEAVKDRLTEEGAKQAFAAAEAFKDITPDINIKQIYHSPAVRATQTAEILAKSIGDKIQWELRMESISGIAPLSMGKSPKANVSPGRVLVADWAQGKDTKLEDGESLAEMSARVKKGILEIVKNTNTGGQAIAVAHGEVLLTTLCSFDVKKTMAAIVSFSFPNAGILAFDIDKDGTFTLAGLFASAATASKPK
ncbi:MAG: histidine phosphatase family protein [Planctomycetota bacterium]